jgi:hypothetical protein
VIENRPSAIGVRFRGNAPFEHLLAPGLPLCIATSPMH